MIKELYNNNDFKKKSIPKTSNLMDIDFELHSIPEDSIIVDLDYKYNYWDLISKAIKIAIEERELNKLIKINNLNNRKSKIIRINNFHTQIVICNLFDKDINVPITPWSNRNRSPQLILGVKIDNNNNIVNFLGVLTAKEFENIFYKTTINDKKIRIPIQKFEGGIDLLFSYVRLNEPSSIESKVLQEEVSSFSLNKLDKKLKISFPIIAAAITSIVFGSNIYKPNLIANISKISGQSTIISQNTRSQIDEIKKICIISPIFNNKNLDDNLISVDKPLLLFKEPLNEIKIIKNNKIIWQKLATSEERIIGPINWPVESINKNDSYQISFRPIGSPIGNEQIIRFKVREKSFNILSSEEKRLGKYELRWIRKINKNLEKDPNLSLALLFSNKAPQSEIITKTKYKLLNKTLCN